MDGHTTYCTWIATLTLPNQNERNCPVGLLNCWVFMCRYFQLSWARTRIRAPRFTVAPSAQINTTEECFAWLIHESINGTLIPLVKQPSKILPTRWSRLCVLLLIPTKFSVTTSQFWEKKQATQDRFVQRFESALQNLTGNTSRRLPLVAHQPPWQGEVTCSTPTPC